MALLLLSGCSALRFTYNQGPVLSYWWLDGYMDFNEEQAPQVKQALADWFGWHRQTQLSEYASWLASVRPLAHEKVTATQMCAIYDGLQRRLDTAYAQAAPAMAVITRTITPSQIDHLEKRYARKNQEVARDFLQPDLAERAEASLKRTVDRAEIIYGSLDDAQRKLLADGLAVSPFDPQRWMSERRARQQEVVRTLRRLIAEKAEAPVIEAAVRRFAADTMSSPRPEYRAYVQRLVAANCELSAQLHNSLKPVQRQHAADRLKSWEDDLRALASD